MMSTYKKVYFKWNRLSLLEYTGNFSAQALSVFAFAAFLMHGVHLHA